jgi:hypothetical protein
VQMVTQIRWRLIRPSTFSVSVSPGEYSVGEPTDTTITELGSHVLTLRFVPEVESNGTVQILETKQAGRNWFVESANLSRGQVEQVSQVLVRKRRSGNRVRANDVLCVRVSTG